MVVAILLALASVVAILGISIRFALGRAGDSASSCDQDRRILLPVLVFTSSITLFSFLTLLAWADPVMLFGAVIVVLVASGTGSLVVIAATDVAAKAVGARRTRAWLIAGMTVFIGSPTLALLAFAGAFSGAGDATLLPAFVPLIALAVATALIWWSYLPVDPVVAGVFE
jgi:hypothetical protein